MKRLFSLAGLILLFFPLFGVDQLLSEQQAAKELVGVGLKTNNWIPYFIGVQEMQATGVGKDLIDYITSYYVPHPTGGTILNTTGMIGLPTFPVVGKYMLLVDPSVYSSLSPNEKILVKDQNLFSTIQSAINFVLSDPTNTTSLNRWTILVAPGTYLENLTIGTAGAPSTSVSITLAALGTVILGDGSSTGTVNWTVGLNTLLSGARYQGLMFTVYRTADTNYNARWTIKKNFNTFRAASFPSFKTLLMQLHYTTVMGTVTATGAVTDLFECVFDNAISIDPTNTASYLMVAQGCLFKGHVSVYNICKINGCIFQNGISGHNTYVSTSENIYGFYRSQIAGSCTMTTGSFLLDAFTNNASTATFSSKTIMQ